jgi:hypothetical protein
MGPRPREEELRRCSADIDGATLMEPLEITLVEDFVESGE